MPIRKSRVSSTPSGTTADRPSNPSIGDTFYNGTLGVLEIYTSAGWLPATGANDFNIVLTGSETFVTLDKDYFAGAYTVSSSLADTSFDIYLYDNSNQQAGYTKVPSINATGNFNKILVYGGTNGDLLSFAYKTTFTTSSTTSDTFAPAYVASVSPSDLPNIDDTTTITGGNFDTDIEVYFVGQNDYSEQAKSVVYGSSTSVVATRPDSLINENDPHVVRVVNPGTNLPTGSKAHEAAITAGADPVWVTTDATIPYYEVGQPYSYFLQVTDEASISSYSMEENSLPPGLTLNSETGEISGTPSTDGPHTVTFIASDPSGNSSNKTLTLSAFPTGGAVSAIPGYRVHTFTGSGTFQNYKPISGLQFMIVAGGGGSGWDISGGGGGGGVVHMDSPTSELSAGDYPIAIGAGGAGANDFFGTIEGNGLNGVDTTAFGYRALGGGGSGYQNGNTQGNGGGSGGGSGGSVTSAGGPSTQEYVVSGAIGNATGYGNPGGASGGEAPNYPAGGGGGAGQIGATPLDSSAAGGRGGNGIQINIDGNNYYWAGGGGGGSYTGSSGAGDGGLGGGGGGSCDTGTPGVGGGSALNPGANGSNSSDPGAAGGANTGGGAGGAWNQNTGGAGGAGGSGIVIVRYPV